MSDTIPQLGDPFSAAASQQTQPGFLGQSPAFWQHLAMFGGNLSQAANARTGSGHLANGTGFAGPFGAAIGETARQSQEQAANAANIGRAQAQTQGLNLENQLRAGSLPFQMQLQQTNAKIMQGYLQSHPELLGGQAQQPQSYDSGPYTSPSFAPPPNQPGAPAPTAASYATAVNTHEGNGKNPRSSAQGVGQFTDSTWGQFAQENPQYFKGMNPSQAMAARSDPHLGTLATEWLATKNAPVLAQNGVEASGPNLAMAHYLGPTAAAAVAKAPNGMPVSQVLYQTVGPQKTQEYIDTNPKLAAQTVAGLRNQYAGIPSPNQYGPWALGKSQQLTDQATQAQMLQRMGLMLPGDAPMMQQQAMEYLKAGLAPGQAAATKDAEYQLQSQYAPQIAGATKQAEANVELNMGPKIAREKAIAEAGVKPQMDRFGNLYGPPGPDGLPTYLGRGAEVKEGYNPATGNYEYTDVGGIGVGDPSRVQGGAAQPGQSGITAKPGPAAIGNMEAMPKIAQHFIEQDGKMVDEDLSHVIENVTPAKQALFQLRALNPDANTGAAGELRANFKNWVQTFAPDFVSQLTGDASPAQEFKKIALMGAGKQERGDLGARGGFRAIEMYTNANPNLENTPTANHDMANALLISHQYHEDYAQGATGFFNQQIKQAQQSKSPENYTRLSNYDKEYISKMRPELYASAISAINGKPSQEWAKGLTPKQVQIVGGVLQRADPSATIDLNGHQVPVTAFKNVMGPEDITVPSNGR